MNKKQFTVGAKHKHYQVKGEPDLRCDFGTLGSPILHQALDGIMHFHAAHSGFCKITRFRDFAETPEEREKIRPPDRLPSQLILIVTDPEWIARISELIAPEFPAPKEQLQ
jgi:hypothetical protein